VAGSVVAGMVNPYDRTKCWLCDRSNTLATGTVRIRDSCAGVSVR
jgi:hypothetical protein